MGQRRAAEMAQAVKDNWIDLGTALHWHLRFNHYPPMPIALINVAVTAIERANVEDYDSEIDLPQDVMFLGKTSVSVCEAINSMQLDCFITVEE